MIKEFCDRCGKQIIKNGPSANSGGHPCIEVNTREGAWRVNIKVLHMIGGSVGGEICFECVEDVKNAMSEALTSIFKCTGKNNED